MRIALHEFLNTVYSSTNTAARGAIMQISSFDSHALSPTMRSKIDFVVATTSSTTTRQATSNGMEYRAKREHALSLRLMLI